MNSYVCDKGMFTKLVEQSYDLNEYNATYRGTRFLTGFETHCLHTLLERLPDNPSILDLGCGCGYPYDKFLIDEGCKLTGIDISKRQVSLAVSNCPNGKFMRKDFTDYVSENTYDGVISLYSLFHVPREYHKRILRNMWESLKEHGTVLITVYTKDTGSFKRKNNWCGQPMLWSNYDAATFYDIAESVGFIIKSLGNEIDFGSSESHVWTLLIK